MILACRNLEKAADTRDTIQNRPGEGTLETGILDLSDLESIKQFAHTYIKIHDQLDLLINNAGVATPPRSTTTQGYELQFGVNYLGNFALTGYLYPLLKKTPGSRVVTLSSMGYEKAEIDFENLRSEKSYDPLREYRQSKLANLLFALELQRRITAKGDEVLSLAAQPGANNTDLLRHATPEEIRIGKERIGDFMDPSQGALSTLYAAVSDDVSGGNLYEPDQGFRGYPALASIKENGLDETVSKKLWEISEQFTGLKFP